jgi:Cu/Ag efflux protein CusF
MKKCILLVIVFTVMGIGVQQLAVVAQDVDNTGTYKGGMTTGTSEADHQDALKGKIISIDKSARRITILDTATNQEKMLTVIDANQLENIKEGDRVNVIVSPNSPNSATDITKE